MDIYGYLLMINHQAKGIKVRIRIRALLRQYCVTNRPDTTVRENDVLYWADTSASSIKTFMPVPCGYAEYRPPNEASDRLSPTTARTSRGCPDIR